MQAALNEASDAVTSTLKRSLSLRPMQLQLAAQYGFSAVKPRHVEQPEA
jgi:hypothetical protein